MTLQQKVLLKKKPTSDSKELRCYKCSKVLAKVELKPESKVSIKCPRCKNMNGFTA